MIVMVVDAQGGGIGRALIEKMREKKLAADELVAVGTNVLATSAMLKAGADCGATGENAVIYNAGRADIITGSLGIIAANSMLGEVSPRMAAAVAESAAVKILVPTNRCNLKIAGIQEDALPQRIEDAVELIREQLRKGDGR